MVRDGSGEFFRTSSEVALFLLVSVMKRSRPMCLVYFCEGGGMGVADTNM